MSTQRRRMPDTPNDLIYTPIDDDEPPGFVTDEVEPFFPSPHPADSSDSPPPDQEMQDLLNCDLGVLFGPDGPLASQLASYELRPSQVTMAETVKTAILTHQHALVEAPTGTGKSIAYLIPAILSGKKVVISTANKSLQAQLFQKDIPFLRQVLGRPITAVVVKGRSNYICNLKWDKEQVEQKTIALYDREHDQIKLLRRWLDKTHTGDVDDLPFMLSADLRPRIVSYPDDCLHSDCHYDEDNCWVNHMRDAAAQAQVIVTNHHLLLNALELGVGGERILPPAAIYVVDEAHHLEQIATAVFETAVTDYTVEQLMQRALVKEHVPEHEIDQIRFLNTLAFQEVANQNSESAFRIEVELEAMKRLGGILAKLGGQLKQSNPYAAAITKAAERGERPDETTAQNNRYYELAIEAINSAATKLQTVATAKRDESTVRYAVRVFDRRYVNIEVHAAPIDPAGLLAQYLFYPENDDGDPIDRTVICTSATLATDSHFAHFRARCGVRDGGVEAVLPAVFDYPNQALLYQPPLPAYNYRAANAYYDAVAGEIERLLEVSRGRTLCLFTNWSGLQMVSDRLRADEAGVIWPVRAQGDAPRDALLAWFKETQHSVLLATRSFWEGVDIPGDDLSLVVLDKMPFPTPSDPLHGARMKAIDDAGGSSFAEYMTPLMTLALKQGFGRLIRRSSDRGVVAILDERLTSKGYGRQARRDLPPARFSREFRDVHRFYQDALETRAEFAVNVWAWQPEKGGAGMRWRWQLLRLQDGKADLQDGIAKELNDPVAAELHAAALALQDLHDRIQRAGRKPEDFTVEVRCSPLAVALNEAAVLPGQESWRALRLVPILR